MKKIITLLLTIIIAGALYATIPDIATGFKNGLKLDKSYYDGLLTAYVEFSQEEYDVGDIIDVTIHLEVNTAQNTEDLKFAVTDYKNKALYAVYQQYDQITKGVIESQKKEFAQSTATCKFIKCDPDLILSNENPTGDYHITFKLTKKCRVLYFLDKPYPFYVESLSLYAFTEAKTYPYITEYTGCRYGGKDLNIPIKLHPAARIYEKPSRTPGTGTGKPKRQLPTKQTPVKIGRGGRETLEVVHAFIFHV
jgi:hypothetical protein